MILLTSTLQKSSHWRRFCLVVLLVAAFSAHATAEVLRVLAWPGYADADLVQAFEQRTGARVEVTTIDTDEALWQKINHNKGQDFDVLAINTADLQRCIANGLVQPVNTAAVPNVARQLPRFRNVTAIAGLVHEGQVFGVPYTYAEMGLIYDRQQVSPAPDSITALWDSRWRGRVLLHNSGSHNFSLAAQALGNASPFKINPQQWPAAVDKLIDLRRNALGFYAQPEESAEQFKNRKAAIMLANYGSQQVKLLKSAGVDVGYAIPREGALAWLDVWAITRGTSQLGLAHQWINYLLEAAPGEALTSRQGLASTTSTSQYLKVADRLLWLEPVEDIQRRSALWERIYSGDRARQVLAP
jgi:putative spermidine/putrescine transport system substrate-binding protein